MLEGANLEYLTLIVFIHDDCFSNGINFLDTKFNVISVFNGY